MARRALSLAALLVLGGGVMAPAQEDYQYGRIRYADPGVVLQRATETEAEDAVPNMPFLPGDRVWTTDGRNRLEVQFADGVIVRLDGRSKLDYSGRDERREGQIVLQLWSGSLYVHQTPYRGGSSVVVQTPSGVVEGRSRGVYRIDVRAGDTELSVFEGEALLESQRVRAGERLLARGGSTLQLDARFFDRAEADDFARWDDERQERSLAAAGPEYVPEEVGPYMGDLASAGSWYYEAEVGHVWRPYVAQGWRPYVNGRWVWTAYGWTWIPAETWGWAPFHYGRWGHSVALGWYWIPGRAWSPAWVSWAVGTDYIGWCPLGRGDRPIYIVDRGYNGPRTLGSAGYNPWVYARRGDLRARNVAPHLVARARFTDELRVLDSPRTARVNRDFSIGEPGTAGPRARTRSGPADTVPELRTHSSTTIPTQTARPRYDSERVPGHLPSGGAIVRPVPEPGRVPMTALPSSNAVPAPAADPGVASSPLSHKLQDAPRSVPSRPSDGDRELLRPVFRPLSHPRPSEEGNDRGEGRGRPQPQAERPQPQVERSQPQVERSRPERAEAMPRVERSEPRSERGGRNDGAPRTEGAGSHARPSGPPPDKGGPPRSDGGGREQARPRGKDKDR
jgi:uncharacterized protein DUF6600/FecR-like protein